MSVFVSAQVEKNMDAVMVDARYHEGPGNPFSSPYNPLRDKQLRQVPYQMEAWPAFANQRFS